VIAAGLAAILAAGIVAAGGAPAVAQTAGTPGIAGPFVWSDAYVTPPRDRRIVHLALRDNPAVRTESQGADPYRKIVIFPAEKK